MNKDKKFLIEKGFKDGEPVRFGVENQISGCYIGPLNGRLNLSSDEAYIDAVFKGKPCIVTINKGYDAYVGTIEKDIDVYHYRYPKENGNL